VNEIALVRRIAAKARLRNPRLIQGIGDDCAIWRPGPGEDLVFTTDLLLEGVHFTRDVYSASDIGHKALARGLSDIAAMGAAPRFCLLSLALAPDCDARWVDSFYSGLLKLAGRCGVDLAGGDLAHSDHVLCDIVVCGVVPQGRALRRARARPGDAIYVSGRLGRDWHKYRRPVPRIELGLKLRGRASACMDLTDGLSLDLHRLCSASGIAASLDQVPVRRGFTVEQALNGGEDYELLWTMPPGRTPPRGAIRIGEMKEGPPGLVLLNGVPVHVRGYDHFQQ
jgi:thiamine-monophosphate kinase